MKHLLLLIFCLILTLPLVAVRRALIIGNSAYQDSPLRNPVNDAKLMATILSGLDFSISMYQDLDAEAMERVLDSFSKSISELDEVFFYFSGHAFQIDSENYLLPLAAKLTDEISAKHKSIKLGMILSALEKADIRIVVLDACRDNPYSLSRSAGGRGLAPVTTKSGNVHIVYSTGPGSVAEDGMDSNSRFTQSLANHLQSPGLPFSEVISKVTGDMKRLTNNRQIPWISSSVDRVYVLNKLSGVMPHSSTIPADVQITYKPKPKYETLEFTLDITPNKANEKDKLFLFWELRHSLGYNIPNLVNNFTGKAANLRINSGEKLKGWEGIIYDGNRLLINAKDLQRWYQEIFKKPMPKAFVPLLRANVTNWEAQPMLLKGDFYEYQI